MATAASRSSTARPKPYLLLITVQDIEDPPIERLLSIPPSATFLCLHKAIQISLGWTCSHAWTFKARSKPPQETLHFQIAGSKPPRPMPFSTPEETAGWYAAKNIRLQDFFEQARVRLGELVLHYEYDFGDGWVVPVTLIGRAENDENGKPVCVTGQAHGPVENCGGVGGLWHLRRAFDENDVLDQNQLDSVEWYEETFGDVEPNGFRTWEWHVRKINGRLARLKTD